VLFSTLTYAVFFAIVFAVSWALAPWRRVRVGFLLFASYVIYAGWTVQPVAHWAVAFPAFGDLVTRLGIEVNTAGTEGVTPWSVVYESAKFVPLLFTATSIDWLLGVLLGRTEDPAKRKAIAVGTVVVNVGLLVYFKYWNWGAETFTWLAQNVFAVDPGPIRHEVDLPLGISFFCFMSLSYVIDVYRCTIPYCKSYLSYLTYISFFPHLLAGPIIRGRDLLPHLERDTHLNAERAGEGLFLIAQGLLKKIVICDYIANNFVHRVFESPDNYSGLESLAAMYGYVVKIYCDFSGYSDIAIGSALLLGYRFKINFDAPLKSLNIVEFWRRWHVSLSTWLRDYVYIPLGGGRKGKLRQYFNMFFTMVVCGVWHGAAWTYLVFGCIQGVALTVTHFFQSLRGKRAGDSAKEASVPLRMFCVAANFTFVAITFTMFKAKTLATTWTIWARAATFSLPSFAWGSEIMESRLKVAGMITLGIAVQWLPRRWYNRIRDTFINLPVVPQAIALLVVAYILKEFAVTKSLPFEYFDF